MSANHLVIGEGSPILTIAIPSFNRNKLILENVSALLCHLGGMAKILVVDNCSPVAVSDTLSKLIQESAGKLSVCRNTRNIGANANILKCIELCDTPYIWIVGDDDFILAEKIEEICLLLTREQPVWLNYYSPDIHQPERKSSAKSVSLLDFLKSLDSINELVFISNNIYKTASAQAGLQSGIFHQSTMAPHVIAMLAGIKAEPCAGLYLKSDSVILKSISNNTDATTAWPLYQAFIGVLSLYQLPWDPHIRAEVIRLTRGARKGWLKNRYMASGFSSLSARVGPQAAFFMLSSVFFPLLIIDGFRACVSWPVALASIIFGKQFIKIKTMIRRNLTKEV